MSASVLDRFIFGNATATRAIPATSTQKSGEKAEGIARIARIAVASANDYDFFDATSDVPDDRTESASDWWATIGERVTECDRLINQLCTLRNDTAAERADLLKIRRHASLANLDTDLEYLAAEISALAPAPPEPATGRCIDCASFRRAGLGERCGHLERSLPGEPPLADCLPVQACGLFIDWRNP